MSYTVDYSEEKNYLIRKFQGKLNPNDIKSTWEYLIEEKLKKHRYIGVISDYTNAELNMELDDFDHLLVLLKKNSELLENFKIVVVMNSPINSVFPLFSLRYSQFDIKSFSTVEAAKIWMLESSKP
ncbi:MAG: hypothetical protein PF485_04220 [Bacteroidales bacterium]|jgi:hypothetical protein|nr:hypothetical protein [Bacteroidales bacterium]